MNEFIRNFRKQKTVGILNICSLSLGVMVAVIIGIWTITQLRFDNFHTAGDRIYRVVENMQLNGKWTKYGGTFKPFGEAAAAKEPDIEQMCRVVLRDREEIEIDNIIYSENKVVIADNNFFTFFTFPLKDGNPESIFSAPDNVIIDEATALKYFPGKNAVGQTIRFKKKDFHVSAIMKNMPTNSHLKANIVFPLFGTWLEETWGNSDEYMTYFLLNRAADVDMLNKRLTDLIYETVPAFRESGVYLELQALKDIYFSKDFINNNISVGNKSLTVIFVLTAVIILIISCINFINLFVSTSFVRAKAIGIKKSQGADRYSLMKDFYTETFFYTFIAIAIGLILAVLLTPFFNRYAEFQIEIDFKTPILYVFLIVLFCVVSLIAGSFPAFYMTKFGIIETLMSKFRGIRVSLFQKTLIIIQFTVSILLLIVVFFINKQVNYLIEQDLGFNKENVIWVNSRADFGKNFDVFRDELMKNPVITDITMKNSLPTEWVQGLPLRKPGVEEGILMETCYVKPNYFDFFEMPVIMGFNPFNQLGSDDSIMYCVVNETAARKFGYDNPVDKVINTSLASHIKIIIKGVVKDSYTKSFHTNIDPQVYFKFYESTNSPIFFKIKGDPLIAVKAIEEKWNSLITNVPFSYNYLDDNYKQLYTSEKNLSKMLSGAMVMSFLISVIGLFAISYYSIQRRIKEIGIRKINGATALDVLLLLNKDFVIWVMISFVLACPVAFLFLKKQLSEFVIQTPLSIWVFLLAGLITLIITLLTVSYLTIKAADSNPVKSIKNE